LSGGVVEPEPVGVHTVAVGVDVGGDADDGGGDQGEKDGELHFEGVWRGTAIDWMMLASDSTIWMLGQVRIHI